MAQSSKKHQSKTSKRSQRKAETKKASKQSKKQIAHSRKDARQRRIVWLSAGALAALVLIIVGVGIVRELVLKPNEPVATVNGVGIPVEEFQDSLVYRRYNLSVNATNLQNSLDRLDPKQEGNEFLSSFYEQQLGQIQSARAMAAQTVLDELIDDQLIAEKAKELGITVTDDEIQKAIFPEPQTPISGSEEVPTPIPQEELDRRYEGLLTTLGISDKAFRNIVRRGVLREKVQEELATQVATTGPVAHVQLIQTDTQDKAVAAQERIEAGEEWALVAQKVSSDTMSVESGGDLGWVTAEQLRGRYGPEVGDSAFSAEIGTLALVESNGQFYLILVVERDENGPLPDEILSAKRNSALLDWLTERKASPDVEIERLLQSSHIPPDPFGQ